MISHVRVYERMHLRISCTRVRACLCESVCAVGPYVWSVCSMYEIILCNAYLVIKRHALCKCAQNIENIETAGELHSH